MDKRFDAIVQLMTTDDTPIETYEQIEQRLEAIFRKIPGDRDSILRLIKRFMLEVNKYYLELPFID